MEQLYKCKLFCIIVILSRFFISFYIYLDREYSEENETWWSIFPVENEELVFGKWEDDVIWDSEVSIFQLNFFCPNSAKHNAED